MQASTWLLVTIPFFLAASMLVHDDTIAYFLLGGGFLVMLGGLYLNHIGK